MKGWQDFFQKDIAVKLDHRALRAIGQDLETIGLIDFDLELEGERCVVRGMVVSPASPEPSPPSRGLKDVWKFWKSESDVPSEQAPVPVERVYLPDDIDRLVAEGQSRRRDKRSWPKKDDRSEVDAIAESLRVLAFYCETAGLQPVSVSKRGKRLKCGYLTSSGVRQVEERDFSELYNFSDGMVLKRGGTRA